MVTSLILTLKFPAFLFNTCCFLTLADEDQGLHVDGINYNLIKTEQKEEGKYSNNHFIYKTSLPYPGSWCAEKAIKTEFS